MENVVKLSRTERAQFIYLLKILKNQGDQDYDYDNLIKALQYGFELHYSDVFECLFDEELTADAATVAGASGLAVLTSTAAFLLS